jgi:hypothetical protein
MDARGWSRAPQGENMLAAQQFPKIGRMVRLAACLMLAAIGPLHAQQKFPHPAHQRLFPLCAGCHAAAEFDASSGLFPPPALCSNCHDGSILQRVQWTPPVERAAFNHPEHARTLRSSGVTLECTDCHVTPGALRMGPVVSSVGTACAGCHSTHRANSNCSLCHAPAPGGHDRLAHASCDACHERVRIDALPLTRNLCLVCHTDLKAHAAPRNCVECHPLGRGTGRKAGA